VEEGQPNLVHRKKKRLGGDPPKVVIRLSLREINCFTSSTYMPHYQGYFLFFCFIFCKLNLLVLVNKALYFYLGRMLRSNGGASIERVKCCGVQQKNPCTPHGVQLSHLWQTLYPTVPKVASPLGAMPSCTSPARPLALRASAAPQSHIWNPKQNPTYGACISIQQHTWQRHKIK
jgi:hypothetical protein